MGMKNRCNLITTIGLKVVAIRGYKTRKNQAEIKPDYILFDDGKTYIELISQDYMDYHDCDSSARIISLMQNEDKWKAVMEDNNNFANSNLNIEGY